MPTTALDAPARAWRPGARGDVALILCAAVWGLGFVAIKGAVADQPVLGFDAWRFLVAGLALAAVAGRRLRTVPRAGLRGGALTGAVLAAGYTAQTFALRETSVSHVGFLVGTFVVLTPLLTALLLRRRITRPFAAGVAAATVGLALISGSGGRADLLGDGLALVCAVMWALQIILVEQQLRHTDPLANAAIQMVACALCCNAVAALTDGTVATPLDVAGWRALLFVALVPTAFCLILQVYGQTHVAAERSALLLASQPAFAAVAGFALDGDRLGVSALAGAVLLLGAIVGCARVAPTVAATADSHRTVLAGRSVLTSEEPSEYGFYNGRAKQISPVGENCLEDEDAGAADDG